MNVKLIKHNGVTKVEINGEIIEPLSFKSFRPTEKNISDFAKAGVKLFSILSSGLYSILGVPYSLYGESWVGDGGYDFEKVDRQIDLFLKNAPNCYFALMIQLDTREWFLKENKNVPNSFTNLSQMASDETWRTAAGEYLKAVLTHTEEKYGEQFYGYFMLCGTTTEWFSNRDYEETHPIKEKAYQQFAGDETIKIPTKEERELDGNIAFVTNQNLVRYRTFHHELIAESILYFARVAQSVLKHKKLLGVYFGYLFELDGPRLWNDGHLAYEKVFTSDDIDMISSPSSYSFRDYESTSAFMVTYDTLNIRNKLYYLEFDHITHLAPQFIEGHGIPGYASKFKDEAETIEVMRRDFILCAAKGAALWWFDMFEGWFYSDGMMNEIAKMIQISEYLGNIPQHSCSEIAVFAEGESLYHANKNAKLNTDLLGYERGELAKMGAPYDLYSICDLQKEVATSDRYKLYIFLDSFQIPESDKRFIEEKLKAKGKSILWIYAPGYISETGYSLSNLCELVGMTIKENPLKENSIQFENKRYGFQNTLTPSFYVEDETASTLGTFDSGKTALAYQENGKGNLFYSACGRIPAEVFRKVASLSGVHLYSENNVPVYVNDTILGVFAPKEGTNLYLSQDCTLTELFTQKTYLTKDKTIEIDGETRAKLFLIEKKGKKNHE